MVEEKIKITEGFADLLQALEDNDASVLAQGLANLHPADIGDFIESISPERRLLVWQVLMPEVMGEVLLELPVSIRADLLAGMETSHLVDAVRDLDTDDIADLIPELPDEVIAEILFALDTQDRQRLNTVLSYAEDTAGGLMNLDAVTVRENISLEVVLRYLRRRGELPEHTHSLFVVDRNGKLIGTLLLRVLLTSDPGKRVGDVMDREPVSFSATEPDNEVAAAFEKYNLITAAVLDDHGRLLGRITVDDVVDVIREEAYHSVMVPAGLREDEDIFAPVVRSSRNRALWLGVNLATAILASIVIGFFQSTIQKIVALAVLMPIVASMGGNAGTQTLVLVVRGIALGTVTRQNARQVLVRELAVSLLNSFLWALVIAVVAIVWYHEPRLGLIIGISMAINLVAAALSGVLIPLAVKKLGVDPALASGVVLTTVTDVVGFFSFLALATAFLT
ncbi:MAG: magnesium transporter [Acidiferrobacterales bacterium]